MLMLPTFLLALSSLASLSALSLLPCSFSLYTLWAPQRAGGGGRAKRRYTDLTQVQRTVLPAEQSVTRAVGWESLRWRSQEVSQSTDDPGKGEVPYRTETAKPSQRDSRGSQVSWRWESLSRRTQTARGHSPAPTAFGSPGSALSFLYPFDSFVSASTFWVPWVGSDHAIHGPLVPIFLLWASAVAPLSGCSQPEDSFLS